MRSTSVQSASRDDALDEEQRAGPSRTSPLWLLATSCLIWFAGLACAAAFYISLPNTAWHDPTVPLPARVGLLGLEAILLAYVSLFVTLFVFLIVGSRGREGEGFRAGRLRWAGVGLVLWVASFAYAASWITFRSTGHFLDLVTLRLWWSNAALMFQHATHMEPLTPIAAVLGTVAFATALTIVLARSGSWLTRRVAAAVSMLGGAVLVACVVVPTVTEWGVVRQVFDARRTEATGPLTHFAADLRSHLAASADPTFRRVQPVVERRPLVPLAVYLRENGGGGTGSPSPRATSGGASAPVEPRHSVLLVVVESLRPDQLRAYGGERSVMPTLDAIADSARVFARHYTQASHSDYADPSLLSSHYPLRSSTYHIYPKDPAYPRVLVYDVLGKLGYRVGIFSSQNESWSGMADYLRTGSIDRFLHSETYEGPTYVPDRDPGFATWARGARKSGKIDDRFTVSEAIDWIAEDDGPFFIYMNLQNSHVPYVIPADFDPPFGPGRVSFPIRFGSFPRDSVEAVKDLYASSLAYIDAQLARLVDFLEQEGRWDETIVVVTGDTGQAFYEHGFTSHASALYDEVMRVPLLIRAPGLEPGREAGLSQHIDVPPTVLGLLGLAPHPSFQGVDLMASGSERAGERTVYLVGQALAHQYAIVRGPWKLLYDLSSRRYEAYHLLRDPGEREDRAAARPDVVDRLAPWLHAWRKAQLDYYSDPTTYHRWYPPILTGVRVEAAGEFDRDPPVAEEAPRERAVS